MGLVAPWYVKSSWTRAWTRVPCIGSQIPVHCVTGKSRPTHFKCKVWWTLVLIVVNRLYYGHHSYTVISAPLLSVSSHSPWPQGNHLSAVVLPFLEFHIGRRQWHPTPVLLPGKSHGWRSLVGCSPWGCWGSDTTEQLHFPFSLSCIGEGNGNPLQCSCLENPRDGGAWWAAFSGIAQSRTQLKWLSSSRVPYKGSHIVLGWPKIHLSFSVRC